MSDEEDIKFKRTMSNRTEMVYGHDTIEKISQLTENEKINTPDIYTFSSIVPSRYYLKDLFPLKKYKFEKKYFYGPNNPSPFLTCCYGDYMTLPPIERRRIHSYDVKFI